MPKRQTKTSKKKAPTTRKAPTKPGASSRRSAKPGSKTSKKAAAGASKKVTKARATTKGKPLQSKKRTSRSTTVKKATVKETRPKKPAGKKAAPEAASKPQAKSAPAKSSSTPKKGTSSGTDKPSTTGGRKGITIVDKKKPTRRSPSPSAAVMPQMPALSSLLGSGKRKPLIPSGPGAARASRLGVDEGARTRKSPFNKRQLNRFRTILLGKRAELVGDISTMETEALQGGSGSLSNLPQHMADQGSDAYEQGLSLDLAAADRKLLKEIDDALRRIADGTYGVCELTGQPINPERLEELPWTRLSIQAAREMERRSGGRV